MKTQDFPECTAFLRSLALHCTVGQVEEIGHNAQSELWKGVLLTACLNMRDAECFYVPIDSSCLDQFLKKRRAAQWLK